MLKSIPDAMLRTITAQNVRGVSTGCMGRTRLETQTNEIGKRSPERTVADATPTTRWN
jgi:hypothetical protein